MIKKILPLFAIFAITLVASIIDTTIDQKNYYTPQKEDFEEDVNIEYYCLKDDTILVVFGETEMPVVWNNKKTGKLENLKCEDFKEWATSENILDSLEATENGKR